MRSTRDDLLASLDDLGHFVGSIDPVNKALAGHTDEVVRRYLTIRRRLDYAAFIVALYAAFERFVEDLVWSYAELVSSGTKYADLPEKLRGRHIYKSADLIARGHVGEGRYADLKEADLVSNLHGCLSGAEPYKLNRHAVVHHEKNLKASVVQDLFGSFGFANINDVVRLGEPLLRWYVNTNAVEAPQQGVPATVIELRMKDLVDRRNQIAHAGGDPREALSADEMKEGLEFLKAYGSSLFAAVAGAYLESRYVSRPGAATELGDFPEGPYSDGWVVVVRKPACRVYVGQPILAKRADRMVDRWGNIQELKVDDNVVTVVEPTSKAATIGLRLDFRVTDSTKLFLLADKDDVVWG